MPVIKTRPLTARCMINDFFYGDMYSVSDLCRTVGITRQAYYNIINNVSLPRIDVALKICDYFNSLGAFKYSIDELWKLV